MEAKKWYKSKILWVNGLAFVAAAIQVFTGYAIDGATQGLLLTAINIILRAVTREEIVW